jgi:regulator of protease activity HflC (stomatin/prohibitin superfamily)
MALVVLAVLVLLGGLGLNAVHWSRQGDATRHRIPLLLRLVPVALAVLLVVLSCLTTVGTKDVGVVTTFGRPTGRDLENGLHLKWPWQKVNELDGAINPDSYTGPQCVKVRIGDSTTACVEGTIRWRIVPTQASVLYQDYRSDDVNLTIRDSLVKTQFNAALNDVLGKYNPLSTVAAAAAAHNLKPGESASTVTSTAPNLDEFSADVEKSMDEHLVAASRSSKSGGSPQVKVISVTLNFIHLAETTQDKINDFLKEVGSTRVAEQHEQTAQAQANANRQLAASVSNDPNVLVSKCFDAVEEAIKSKYSLPAGFSCWKGGGSAVVVPSR